MSLGVSSWDQVLAQVDPATLYGGDVFECLSKTGDDNHTEVGTENDDGMDLLHSRGP